MYLLNITSQYYFLILIFIIFSCYFLKGKGNFAPAILKLLLIFLLLFINALELLSMSWSWTSYFPDAS